MKFGSVCSGIEAASVAWHPLGFRAVWFSEIEPFPSAVLAHHWPDVPNHGDMLALPARVETGEVAAPDVLVGGTPCQAFSVAGRRESLADARGSLTLAYVELANAIDRRRARDGRDACIIVWENVPGVLNTKDNAFGCFLAGLAGETEPLQPAGKRWTNAGCVLGPQRAVAWRILDAQYYGLAQRRRRVFLVASARAGFDPAQVLFEFEGVRRDTPPRRETREDAAAPAGCGFETAGTLDARTKGGGFPGTDGACLGHVVPILGAGARTGKSTSDPRAGMGIGDAGDPMYTLQAGKQHGVATIPAEGCWWDGGQVSQTLDAVLHKGQTMPEKNRFPAVLQPVGYANKGHFGSLTETEVGDPLRAKGGDTGHGGETIVCAVTADTITSGYGKNGGRKAGKEVGMTNPVFHGLAVRRLTPVECERLQGFPDNHTNVVYRNKPAADGPRYKAIGNSMAVPCMAWIGRRIAAQVGDAPDLDALLDFDLPLDDELDEFDFACDFDELDDFTLPLDSTEG